MATIREMILKFGVKADSAKLESLNRGVGSLAKQAAIAGAALAAVAGSIAAIVASTASVGDDIAKNAERMGVSTDTYQELAFAAELGGTSIASLQNGVRGLSRVIDQMDTAQGAETIERLGITVRDANGEIRPMADLLEDTADSFAGITNEAERSALAQRAFGRAGVDMIVFLSQGSEAIREQRQEAHRLGAVLSQDAVIASAEFVDEMTRLKRLLTGVKNAIGIALMPTMIRWMETMVSTGVAARAMFIDLSDGIENIETSLGPFAQAVVRLASGFWKLVSGVSRFVLSMLRLKATLDLLKIASVVVGFMLLKTALITYVIPAIATLNFGLIASTIAFYALQVAIVAGAAALGIFLQDLWAFMNGHDSAIGRLIERNVDLSDGVNSLGEGILAVFDSLRVEGQASMQRMFNSIEWFVDMSRARFQLWKESIVFLIQEVLFQVRTAANEANVFQSRSERRGTRRDLEETRSRAGEDLQAARDVFSTAQTRASDLRTIRATDIDVEELQARAPEGTRIVSVGENTHIEVNVQGLTEEEAQRAVTNGVNQSMGSMLREAERSLGGA